MRLTVYFCINDCEVEADADFEFDYETPDPLGDNRGGWGATLTGLQLGDLVLTREQAVKMAGRGVVDDWENTAAWEAMETA
jgi:hypothetical protein